MVQQQRHGMQTLVFTHLVKHLPDFVGLVHGLHFHGLRLAHELRRDLGNAFRVGGREQQGLSLGRALLNQLLHVVEEAHVQHAVGFIQHQGLDGIQAQVAARQMVEDATRRPHHHMRPVLQALLLTAQSHATAQGDHFDVGRGSGQAANFRGDLVGQLARRAHHQALHRMKIGGEFFNQWQAKCGGFAAARAGLCNQVLAR